MRTFWNVAKNEESGENELRIDGPIRMEQGFWDWLFNKPDRSATGLEKAIKAFAGKDITVWINSNGGECIAASVVYSALQNYEGKVTVKIDGSAISAASVIAMAGDEILMSPTAIMMIHNPLTEARGEVKDFQKAIEILTEVKESILNAYVKKTKLSRNEISDLMDSEKWMSADTAIRLGFADGKLFEEELEQSEEVENAIMKGARMVYNNLDPEDVLTKLKEFLEQEQNNGATNQQSESEADFLMLKDQLELEKVRF